MYAVAEIFDTISGEAPTVGRQATFVRLFGCPVGCWFCDTLYTVPWDGISYQLGYLKGAIRGDGCIQIRKAKSGSTSRSMRLEVIDKDFVDTYLQFIKKVFGHQLNVRERQVRSGSRVYQVNCGVQTIIDKIASLPASSEEWRGFTAGFFDAEGHHGKNVLSFFNQQVSLLEGIKNYLDKWQIPFAIYGPSPKDKVYRLSLQSHIRNAPHGLTNKVKTQQYQYHIQRFFDIIRPRIYRKYGTAQVKWQPKEMSATAIQAVCNNKLVVLTGGSPTLQQLDELIRLLKTKGHTVQLETEGSYALHNEIPDIVVCSPKANRRYKIHPQLLEHVTIFKYVVDKDFTEDIVLETAPVYLMPEGSPPKEDNIKRVLEILTRHPHWSYGPRLHTELGVA